WAAEWRGGRCPACPSLAAEAGTSWGICLSGLSELTRLPPELGRLTSLQLLDLSWCVQLSDLGPLGRTQLPPAAQPLPVQPTQRPFNGCSWISRYSNNP